MTVAERPARPGHNEYSIWTGALVGVFVTVSAFVLFSLMLLLSGHHHVLGVLALPILS